MSKDKKTSRLGERFSAPPSSEDPTAAPVINGLTPKDDGYVELWAETNGIPYDRTELP